MKGLTAQSVQCLRRLQASEFIPLVSALQATVDSNLSFLVKAQDLDQIRRIQGETAFIQDFLKAVREADSLAKKVG